MSTRIFIDVRESHEYQGDHVQGAINLPLSKITANSKEVLKDLPKDSELIVYCRSGGRAGMAVEIIKSHGHVNVINGINRQQVEQIYLS